ncbi:MAG: FIST N-terminal domain-containing protein [Verrucomicrobiota bacterium]
MGQSVREVPDQAGEDAARMALEGLKKAGASEASTILIMASSSVFKPELVEGVARVFPDKTRIFGVACWHPIGNEDIFINQPLDRETKQAEIKAGVAVLALSGPITVSAASAEATSDLAACGTQIGKALLSALKESSPGKLLLTFGRQPYRQTPPYLDGLYQGLGGKVPVLGMSAKDDLVIFQGKICQKINAGLLLQGQFAIASDIQQGLDLAATIKAAEAVFKPSPEPYAVALISNCAGRAGVLQRNGQLGKDWSTLRDKAPNTSLFGGYCGGEIGTHPDGSALASGHCISIVALKPLPPEK